MTSAAAQSAVSCISVWVLDLDAGVAEDAASSPDVALLSPDERARAGRFVRPQDRRRWAAARAGLRRVLAIETGQAPTDLAFRTSEHGKPRIHPDGPHFNLSHSGGCALVAVSPAAPLGVDVEQPGRSSDWEGMARVVMGETELADFQASPAAEKPALFLRLWTRKEAVLKADGRGLLADPRSLCVGLDAAPVRRVRGPAGALSVHDLALPWAAALATPLAEPSAEIVVRRL